MKHTARIVYNSVNVEATYLAHLLKAQLLEDSKSKDPSDPLCVSAVTMVDYRRELPWKPTKVHMSYIVGTEMHPEHLKTEIENAILVDIYAYDHQYAESRFPGIPTGGVTLHRNRGSMLEASRFGRDKIVEGIDEDQYVDFRGMVMGPHFAKLPKHYVEIAEILDKYQGLGDLDRIDLVQMWGNKQLMNKVAVHPVPPFEPLSLMELVGKELRDLRKEVLKKDDADSLRDFTKSVLEPATKELFDEYLLERAKVKSFIERTNRIEYVGTHNKGIRIFQAAMSREYTMFAARQIHYALDRFALYEDVSNCRVWTISGHDVYDAKRIAEFFNPHDAWVEKDLVIAITDLPTMAK